MSGNVEAPSARREEGNPGEAVDMDPSGPGTLMVRDLVATHLGLLYVTGSSAPNRYICRSVTATPGQAAEIEITDRDVYAIYRATWRRTW